MSSEKDPVARWLEQCQNEKEKRQYKARLEEFCSYAKHEPDALVEKARMAIKDGLPPAQIEDLLRSWHTHCLRRGLAATSAERYYMLVRGFFTANYIRLSRPPRQLENSEAAYETTRVLTQEEVKSLVAAATSTRDRAMFGFLAQTAQRAGVLTAMKPDMIRNYDGLGIVEIPPELLNVEGRNVNKGRIRYKFVIGFDTVRLLSELPRTEWLFRSQKTDAAVSVRQIERIIADAAEKVGIQRKIRTKIGSKYEVHPHIFRRYWKHQMRQGGVTDETLLNYMLGHRLRYGGAYDSYPDEDLLKAHKQAQKFLELLS